MKISFIVPTRNRQDSLKNTLRSITQLNNATDFEVLIIDNGSTDGTASCWQQFQNDIKELKYFFEPIPGLLAGRHLGAAQASGNILCFLDDDVLLDPNYLIGVIKAFDNDQVKLATGPCLPAYEETPPLWMDFFWTRDINGEHCAWLSLLNLGTAEREIDPNFVWGLNFCIRKETLVELDGFHPDVVPANMQQYQGDGESGLTEKAKAFNNKAIYHPEIKVHHLVPQERMTVEYFAKRAFYQGVADSFTNLRKGVKIDKWNILISKFKMHIRPLYNLVMDLIKGLGKKYPSKFVRDLHFSLTESKMHGYNFHQQEFKDKSTVRNWVMKPNYWDYSIPS